MEENQRYAESVAWLKGRRQARDGAYLARVDGAKVLQWLFKYRVGAPRKGYVVVPWCPPRHSGERLRMGLQDRANPAVWMRKAKAKWVEWKLRSTNQGDN